MSDVITDYHAKLFAHELSKRHPDWDFDDSAISEKRVRLTTRKSDLYLLQKSSRVNVECGFTPEEN
jgi:hypothetical protein